MKKILIIRFRRVGDSVISSSLCSTLKQSIPDSEIHYILNENIAPLFQHHPDIDKIITFSTQDMRHTLQYIKKVRKIMKEEQYDIIIDTRSTVKTSLFSIFSLKSKYRIGRRKSYNHFFHNFRVDNRYKGDKDNVQLTLSLLEPLKKEFSINPKPDFRLYYTEKELAEYKSYMESKGIDFSKPVIVCAVTARLEYKVWSKDKIREISQRIIDKYDAQLIFNYGDKKEKEASKELHKSLNNNKSIFTNIEANDLRKLVAMLANSSFFFGNEGGTRHISQALDIPSFAIYPPNIPLNNWLPNKSDRFQGIELADIDPQAAINSNLSYQQKLDLIDVESVWKRLDKMLENYLNK